MSSALEQRILDFMTDREAGDFDALALELFSSQCQRRGAAPRAVADWRDIPPAEFSDEVLADPAAAWTRQVHARALPELFPSGALLLLVDSQPKTALLESLATDAPVGSFLAGPRLDARDLRSWLGARQRDRRAVRLIATRAGLDSLFELLDRRSLKFRLPPGSAAYRVSTGEDTSKAGWSAFDSRLGERLGVAHVASRELLAGSHRTPLLSTPFLSASASASRFPLPHWVRSTDRESHAVALVDLASWSAPVCRRLPAAARVDSSGQLVFELV